MMPRKARRLCALTAAIIAISQPAFSQNKYGAPDLQALMHTPVSVFEFGLAELERDFDNFFDGQLKWLPQKVSFSVDYFPSQKSIRIAGTIFTNGESGVNLPNVADECKGFVHMARFLLGYDDEGKRMYPNAWWKYFGDERSHGWDYKKGENSTDWLSPELSNDLDNMVEFELSFHHGVTTAADYCHATLVGVGYQFKAAQ